MSSLQGKFSHVSSVSCCRALLVLLLLDIIYSVGSLIILIFCDKAFVIFYLMNSKWQEP